MGVLGSVRATIRCEVWKARRLWRRQLRVWPLKEGRRNESGGVEVGKMSSFMASESGTENETKGCVNTVIEIESVVCATGTAYGLLKDKPLWVLALYFCARHAVYFSIAVLLLFKAGDAVVLPLGAFFITVHMYKLISFLAKSSAQERREKKSRETKMGP